MKCIRNSMAYTQLLAFIVETKTQHKLTVISYKCNYEKNCNNY